VKLVSVQAQLDDGAKSGHYSFPPENPVGTEDPVAFQLSIIFGG